MMDARRRVVGLAAMLLALILAGCGAGAQPASDHGASSSSASGAFASNPAIAAALEIIQVQPVVPFATAQIQVLVPILQGLVSDPNLPADQLAAKGRAIEATFTSLQQEALTNLRANPPTQGAGVGAAFFGAGGAGGTGDRGQGLPPGAGGFAARAGAAGAGGASGGRGAARFVSRSGAGSRRVSGAGSGGGPGNGAAANRIYQLAIDTLQGKAPEGFGGRPGAAGSSSASSAAAASGSASGAVG